MAKRAGICFAPKTSGMIPLTYHVRITYRYRSRFINFDLEFKDDGLLFKIFFISYYHLVSAKHTASGRLSDKTFCMVGKMGQNEEKLHYELHNVFGWSETVATHRSQI